MYNNPSGPAAGAAGGGGVLATTGVSPLWLVLAAFALLAAGMAVQRVVPKLKKK